MWLIGFYPPCGWEDWYLVIEKEMQKEAIHAASLLRQMYTLDRYVVRQDGGFKKMDVYS